MRKVLIGLFVLTFAGIASAQVLYEDHFEGGIATLNWGDAWETGLPMTILSDASAPDGDGYVLQVPTDSLVGTAVAGDPSMTDYKIEAQVFVLADSPFSMMGVLYQGIVARLDSSLDNSSMTFYSLRVDMQGSTPKIQLRYFVGATPTTILEWTGGDIPGGAPTVDGWHKLALELDGDQLTAWYDDQQLSGTPVTDTHYSSGQFGLYCFSMDMVGTTVVPTRFDAVLVSEPGYSSAPEGSGFTMPRRIEIASAYPNPFNPETTISFNLDERTANSVLMVYDVMGRPIATLYSGPMAAGNHTVSWNAANQPAGTYFIRLEANGFQSVRRVTLMK